jgi:5-methylcytosine-specific restriction endonuclease McrA
MDFIEQYKHPKWQKKRLEVLQKADYKCEQCGDGDSMLHVHHGYYKKGCNVWDYHIKTLWCLCGHCHRDWEFGKNHIYHAISKVSLDLDGVNDIMDFLNTLIEDDRLYTEDELIKEVGHE